MRLLIFLSIVIIGLSAFADDKDAEKNLEKVKRDILSAQTRIKEHLGSESQMQKSLKSAEKELGKIESKIFSIRASIAKQADMLKQLENEKNQLNKQKELQKQQIIAQINTSYRLGRESRIKLLLNQEDPEKFSRSLVYSDYFNKARIESIEAFQTTLEKLEKNQEAIEDNTSQLIASKENLVKQQKSLQSNMKDRAKALAKLQAYIKTDTQQLAKLKRDRQQLETLLDSVKKAIRDIKLPSDSIPFKQVKGKLALPSAGTLKNRFGRSRDSGDLTWQGVSFYGTAGDNIRAIHHGRVVYADWFRGLGLLIIIDHGNGYMSLYGHNQTLLREPGDWVSGGETIATMGNSGGIDHAELYFEIRAQGKPVNPKYWLQRKG